MRIQGITIPEGKRLEVGLTAVFGVGRSTAKRILDEVGLDYGTKAKDVSADDDSKIRKIIESMKTECELKREVAANIKRLKDIKSYRGSRHSRNLPLNGQRTKTNSRTVRGNMRKTMGSGRRKVEKK